MAPSGAAALRQHMLGAKSGAIVNIGSMSGFHRQQATEAMLLQRVKGRSAPYDKSLAAEGAPALCQCGGADLYRTR